MYLQQEDPRWCEGHVPTHDGHAAQHLEVRSIEQ